MRTSTLQVSALEQSKGFFSWVTHYWLAFVVGWLVPSALMLGLQDALVMMTHDYNFLSSAELAKVSRQFTGHL